MFRPLLVALVVAGLVVSGCRWDSESRAARDAGVECAAGVTARGARSSAHCPGVWVRFPDREFVPQGLTMGPGRTAYVSGYRWSEVIGRKYCQVVQVDRRTGRVLAALEDVTGRGPGGLEQTCRHGGGAALTRHGLWVAGAGRLWLLDPDLEADQPVQRVWIVELPVKASVLAAGRRELVTAAFRNRGAGPVFGYRYRDLLVPGVTTLAAAGATAARVTPSRRSRGPSHLQGIAFGPGGLWFTSSHTRCGTLTTPAGRRIAFVPGAEGIDFVSRRRLWVTSESGSGPYQRMGGRPRVPTLVPVLLADLDRAADPDCG